MAIIATKGNQKTDPKRLGMMLLIVFVLMVWVLLKDDTEDTDAIELVEKKQARQAASLRSAENKVQQSTASTDLESSQDDIISWQKLQREPLKAKVDNVFKVHSWLVVPKVAKVKAPPPPPPPPMAPPAPFTYMGKLEDSPKGTQLFLMRGGKLYTAIKGQKIDAQWRLDNEEIDTINLTYLPLNLPQVLSKTAKPIDIAPPVADEINL
jgi:hypothetical protein